MRYGQGFSSPGYHWPTGVLLLISFSILAPAACVGQDRAETMATPAPVSVAVPRVSEVMPTPTAVQDSAPSSSPTPAVSTISYSSALAGPPSEAELYERIAPSVAFIETPIVEGGARRYYQDGKLVETDRDPDYMITGSGILVEGGYIITSYRLVWPYSAVRIVFSDRHEFEGVPVANFDPLSGLAVLGPIDVPATPLTLGDGEDTAVGSDLFLIAYPEENDKFPQPVMGRGTLQAVWETERTGITYFQGDITVAGGYIPGGYGVSDQRTYMGTISGGALVNEQGELIGISIPIPHTERLSLAASASDIAPIVDRLISGKTRSELSDRRLPSSGGSFSFDFKTRDDWDRDQRYGSSYYRRFLVREPLGTVVNIKLTGHGSALAFDLHDPQKRPVLSPNILMENGIYSGSAILRSAGPHFLTVRYTPDYYLDQERYGQERFDGVQLQSNVSLTPLHDPDDGRQIAVGETIAGNQDVPYDRDWFRIDLEEGETVVISGESVASAFPFEQMTIDVDFPDARENQKVHLEVATGGGGVRGSDDGRSVIYRAPHTGEFFLDVSAHGGYYLSVEEAPAGAEPVSIPPGPIAAGAVETPFGPMAVYRSRLGNFSIQVPAEWELGVDEKHQPFAEYYGAYGPSHQELRIAYDNELIAELGTALDPLEVAAFLFIAWAVPDLREDEMVSRTLTETTQGIPSERFVLSLSDWKIALATYYLSDDNASVCIFYSFNAEDFDELKELADYSFSTFNVH